MARIESSPPLPKGIGLRVPHGENAENVPGTEGAGQHECAACIRLASAAGTLRLACCSGVAAGALKRTPAGIVDFLVDCMTPTAEAS